MDTNETAVIFRKWRNGDIIALFPHHPGTNNPDTCLSYEHIGQHGSCSPLLCSAHTTPATSEEYAPLKEELETIGYRLRVLRRMPNNARNVRRAQIDAIGKSA